MLTRWTNWGENDWSLRDVLFGTRDFERAFAELDALHRQMDRAFAAPQRAQRTAGPRMGLFDQGAELVLRAELPGVSNEDIDINVDHGVLTVRGARKSALPEGYSVHRRERGDWTFARSFTLPFRVDLERTTASLSDGVLTVTLPKAEEEKPRQIAVKTK